MYNSLQEIFDKVATHLLIQKKQSRIHNLTFCQYRGPDGLMCAIGCLIPDSAYCPEIEGRTVISLRDNIFKSFLSEEVRVNPHIKDFLRHLQYIHDSRGCELWKYELNKFAEIYNLNDKVLDNF